MLRRYQPQPPTQSPILTALLKDFALFSAFEFQVYERYITSTSAEVQHAVRMISKGNQYKSIAERCGSIQNPWMENMTSDKGSTSTPSIEHRVLVGFVRERAYLRAQCAEFESQLHTQSQKFAQERAKLEKDLACLQLESQRFAEARAKLEQDIAILKKALEVESQRLLALL